MLVDGGGQKCERSKWQLVVSNVIAIIFVVSLADFDQLMFEDQSERRTSDSLQLFQTTLTTNLFSNIPVYLILNKEDELKRKLKVTPDAFQLAYPSFTGDLKDTEGVIKFIEEQYIAQAPNSQIKTFVTTAVEPEVLKRSFLAVAENLITIN